jgi:hypothetical protein
MWHDSDNDRCDIRQQKSDSRSGKTLLLGMVDQGFMAVVLDFIKEFLQ